MFGGISIWQLVIILLLVVLLFGTKKLRNLGTDLGSAFKGFKKSMASGEQEAMHKQVTDEGVEKGSVNTGSANNTTADNKNTSESSANNQSAHAQTHSSADTHKK